jgi:hypothetical protein
MIAFWFSRKFIPSYKIIFNVNYNHVLYYIWLSNFTPTSGTKRESFRRISYFFHLAKLFQRGRFVRNWPIRKKNRLWLPCLLTNQDEMSKLYREPSIDASYKVSVHLATWFQKWRFLEIDQSETRIASGRYVC